MNRVVKTTIASALVLSMALSGTTAAMAAAPVEEENCISAASIANWACLLYTSDAADDL
mgnify:CR=1 FL=1